ncbi:MULTISPECIES: hypothetical protein [Paracoccus]|jgi:hypothetical protein|uniref:Uncharacterized protein n=3 Tax=Paracoccus TaxID=265 RepID=A1B0P7_PARDP|nr:MULTISPECIES: hypothetical protein [Paracoccus]ABL69091.1 hypothetical protein Pden_0980 [Paracoccus denitrificans PD1222]MBB4630306.1 hypothetical protein [Paracoccus denitrificans]MCU7431670.1 hypothetical protein [Paracoccus denitrificans]QAR27123.1 hypothetical protein EO213_12865 [Paracoccus denitrificans]QFG38319.1 potassium-transporting ATPase subunit C [Paracoccus pantotrophus]
MRTHRQRHHNAYCAGAHRGIERVIERLMAITPAAAHDDLQRVARVTKAEEEFRKIVRKREAAKP